LVKFVGVGFETMVQPLTTVSAAAGVDVAKTGVTNATAITRTVPVTRRRRPTMTYPHSIGWRNGTTIQASVLASRLDPLQSGVMDGDLASGRARDG
jgi:hypothetical protein